MEGVGEERFAPSAMRSAPEAPGRSSSLKAPKTTAAHSPSGAFDVPSRVALLSSPSAARRRLPLQRFGGVALRSEAIFVFGVLVLRYALINLEHFLLRSAFIWCSFCCVLHYSLGQFSCVLHFAIFLLRFAILLLDFCCIFAV